MTQGLLLAVRRRLFPLTWRKVGKAIFFAPAALIGVPGIVVLPFIEPSVFRFAQLGLFVLLFGGLYVDVGMGRDGEAVARHHGFRLLLDHALLLALVGLAFVMAKTAPGWGFRDLWWAGTAGLALTYLLHAPPWMVAWRQRRTPDLADPDEQGS